MEFIYCGKRIILKSTKYMFGETFSLKLLSQGINYSLVPKLIMKEKLQSYTSRLETVIVTVKDKSIEKESTFSRNNIF